MNDQAPGLPRPVKKTRGSSEQVYGAWHCVRPGDERGLQIHKDQAIHRNRRYRGIVSARQSRPQPGLARVARSRHLA
jgi:hypothetical protein